MTKSGIRGKINSKGKSMKHKRYPVTQRQIDGILENELGNLIFPIKPVYNPRLRSNGKVVVELNPMGELNRVKAIEIGKQDQPDKNFLIDTMLHEYLEAEIFAKKDADPFYKKLDEMSDIKRHEWIRTQIDKYFREMEGKK